MTDSPSSQTSAPPATPTTTVVTELPAALREKLRPDLQPHRLGGIAGQARDAVRRLRASPALAQAAAHAKRVLPPLSKAGATAVERVKRFKSPARARLQQLARPDGVAARVFKKGREAGVGLGTTIDKLAQEVPKQRKPAPLDAIDRDDITTEMLARRAEERAKRPAIFGLTSLLTALVTGGLIHIGTTFAIPLLGTGSAFSLLRTLPVNSMIVMPQQAPGAQILPFLQPDMLYAFCRYDLTSAPLVIQARLPETGWSLALYSPQGDNYYAVPGQPQGAVDVSFVLAPATERVLNLMPNARRPDLKLNHVTAPHREGLLVIRAPIKGVSFIETLKDELRGASCTPQPAR